LATGQHFESVLQWMNAPERKHCNQNGTRILLVISYSK